MKNKLSFKAVLTTVVIVLAFTTVNAQDYPVNPITHKITFTDTIKTSLDSARATQILNDYLFTNLQDVKPNGNKTYSKASFEVHKKALGGGIAKGAVNLLGDLNYTVITEVKKGYAIITSTNFQFIGATRPNLINPMYGQKTKIADSPLEDKKLNNAEIWQKLNEQKATFTRLLN